MTAIVDLFAGPGGWDVGASWLGLDTLGIEWDGAACETRKAAGLNTLQADIAELDPLATVRAYAAQRTIDDYAGDLEELISTDEGRATAARVYAERGEPGLWGLIASPPCQAFSMAGKGEGRGDVAHVMACVRDLAVGRDTRAKHNTACSDPRTMLVVEPLRWALALQPEWIAFEQVPPVMPLWRAFADVLRFAGWDVWTGVLEAERYGVPQTRERAILMGHRSRHAHPPEPTHHRFVPNEPRPGADDDLFGGGLLPWVSMAEALGWGMTQRPYPVLACSSFSGGPDMEKVGGSAARVRFRATNERPNSVDRVNRVAWTHDRPATTIAGDSRVHPPGHKRNAEDERAGRTGHDRAGTLAIRVEVQEAALLQSFPADYPWQGTKTAQFRQIGDAVPPLLARAVLAALTSERSSAEVAA